MRAKVNPKPAARNGSGKPRSTDKAPASTEQVGASKDRSRERRQSVSHEAILVPSGADDMRPKPIEVKLGDETSQAASATDQRRSQRR